MRTEELRPWAGALLAASLMVWACSSNDSPTKQSHSNAAGAPADAGEGGTAPVTGKAGNGGDAGAVQAVVSGGAGGAACPDFPHALADLCDSAREPCPMHADADRERLRCSSTDRTNTHAVADEVVRFETTCGGFVFVEQYSLFSIAWEYDANGELVSASPATSDIATDCPPPSVFGAEPCPHVSEEPQILCKDSQIFGGGGAGGAN